jgi:hypothetical protein
VKTTPTLAVADSVYTLIGVRDDGVGSVVDLALTEDLGAARRQAQALLREHRSCSVVEVWRNGALIEQLGR